MGDRGSQQIEKKERGEDDDLQAPLQSKFHLGKSAKRKKGKTIDTKGKERERTWDNAKSLQKKGPPSRGAAFEKRKENTNNGCANEKKKRDPAQPSKQKRKSLAISNPQKWKSEKSAQSWTSEGRDEEEDPDGCRLPDGS